MRAWPLFVVLLAGCPGDDGDDVADSDSDAEVGDTDPTAGFGPVEALFQRSCTTYGCHGGPKFSADLDLSKGKSYDQIVDVPSTLVPSMVRVKPGSLEESFLWYKITGNQAEVGDVHGDTMPPPVGLAGDDLALVEAWILAGAPR